MDAVKTLRIFNTQTHQKEVFEPLHGNKVNFFVCGPTVYDYPHLGHAKTYTQFDFIVRYLRWRGFDVFYLQNITDIDDKIIQRAAERGISWDKLAREFEAIYIEDMRALHNTSVTRYARATDFIDRIVAQVSKLVDKGYGYHTTEGIYYEIAKFPEYGKLSGRTEQQRQDSVSRIDESVNKKGGNDFCLWKAPKIGEPFWDTLIGPGRPGWHIEDTAITESFFGPQYDIHGGAVDLIFPHHEAEIAQMEAASGKKPLVRYWLHTAFLNINSEKMSKSQGNFKTIREALQSYDFRVLRYFFLSAHYRTAIDFSGEVLEQAKSSLRRFDEFIFNIDPEYDDVGDTVAINNLRNTVHAELDDDFNTPRAFAAIFEFMRIQNAKGKSGKQAYRLFEELNGFLDFMDFQQASTDVEIDALVEERERFRRMKDFAKADAIRDRLDKMKVQLYDTKDGVKWRKTGS
jgi:cysteinyl-tRNA synthetase